MLFRDGLAIFLSSSSPRCLLYSRFPSPAHPQRRARWKRSSSAHTASLQAQQPLSKPNSDAVHKHGRAQVPLERNTQLEYSEITFRYLAIKFSSKLGKFQEYRGKSVTSLLVSTTCLSLAYHMSLPRRWVTSWLSAH